MSAEKLETSLRVLYTVNTSPQYILAKAPHKIAFISADNTSSSNFPPQHGRASVKACAMAICRSSPELRPDSTKDFSVYILDPLEDLISKSRHGQSGGVAVGMGLLSVLLSPYTSDSVMVTGTFVGCGQDEDALEVVISLRQVAPPILHAPDDHSHAACSSSRSKSKAKNPNNDKPFFTSNPRPLPSLDERLFASYAQPRQYEPPESRPREPRRPNPAHSTRAHQLPTPYIGPPKRKYMREPLRNSDSLASESLDEALKVNSSEGEQSRTLDETNDGGCSEPSSSQTSMDSVTSTSCSPFTPSETPDLPDALVMLAALSSVSTKPSDMNGTSVEQANANPNPNLVSFLRTYLAALESQRQPGQAPKGVPSEPTPIIPALQLPSDAQTIASESAAPNNNRENVADKENRRPQPAAQSAKDMPQKNSTNTSPLGLSAFNARISDGKFASTRTSNQPRASLASDDDAMTTLQSSDHSRKRKLSNATPSEQDSQVRKRSSSISKGKPLAVDLSGIRVNTGWGGLRVRSDGSLWGEHVPRGPKIPSSSGPSAATIEQNSEQPVFFRSSSKPAASAPLRKGPYIVPDWAKGVPPPEPPTRPEPSDGKVQDRKRERNRSRSSGLGRLGGKSAARRVPRVIKGSDGPITPPRTTSPESRSQDESSVRQSSNTSPQRTPRKLPVFAYSSPAGKSTLATLFQAFQTSPCRPRTERMSIISTPLKAVTTSPNDSRHFSSLFTPSPLTSRRASVLKPRKLFAEDEEEEAPPSPTPTRKRIATAETLDIKEHTKIPFSSRNGGNDGTPSSLPVASSDGTMDDDKSVLRAEDSSDSIIANLAKIHDWTSLDLPPSSPPLPSSPSIAPMEGSDLPCSDIPSSDISDISSSNSSPAPEASQASLSVAAGNTMDFGINSTGADTTYNAFTSEEFSPYFMAAEDGSSALEAIEAFNNGLGQINFSEAWSFMNSICDQVPSNENLINDEMLDMEMQAWLQNDSNSAFDSGVGLSIDPVGGNVRSSTEARGGEDPAKVAATNFESLLNGCVV